MAEASSPVVDRPLMVLAAPDSFKGSLSSVEVADALARGWLEARPTDRAIAAPMADGGEGTLAAVAASGGWDVLPAAARDPLQRPIDGRFLRRGDEAIVELATASGLSRIGRDERDAGAASTFGTGQILAAAIGLGCRGIVLGLGGSATTDGGAGLLAALGVRFLDADGDELGPGGASLAAVATIDLSDLSPVLGDIALTIASDVSNPLLGPVGAAATYGPQKGADPSDVRTLEAALERYADVVESAVGRRSRDVPGAGAAGGTTFGLLAIADRFAALEVRSGVEVVMELVELDVKLEMSDIVLTGEGRVDEQTGFGKTALGVARRAREAGRPTICFGGGVTGAGIETMREAGATVVPIAEAPIRLEELIAQGSAPLARAARRAAELVTIGAVTIGGAE